MASVNSGKKTKAHTHEGAPASKITPLQELERVLLTCLLWENTFYEEGSDLAERVKKLVPKIKTDELSALALKSRHDMNLRHAPLFLIKEMLANKHKNLATLISKTIVRPDDATELLALYWKEDSKLPLPNQLKKGIAKALQGFSEYQLAKYQHKGDIKLVDLFNLSHPKPTTKEQAKLWKKLMTKGLDAPDTWEVRLSAEGNKREIWEEFLKEKKLGGLALLRNLRNMEEQKVPKALVRKAIEESTFKRVLPFRFISAAKYAPHLEDVLEKKMFEGVNGWGKLPGKTVLLIDVSGSMNSALSGKSEMTYMEAACAIAMLCREVCDDVEVYTFSDKLVMCPPRRGFALRDAVVQSQAHSGTQLGKSVQLLSAANKTLERDRLIVFTDEQSQDPVGLPGFEKPYMVNVASYEHTVTTNKWVSISGFSEHIVDFIRMSEQL